MKEETFEQSIMLWHMVTDICYFVTNNAPENSEQGQMREALYRLSNYMMYLLMERPSMMPPGIAEITMEETIFECSFLCDNIRRDNEQVRCYLYFELMREPTANVRCGPGDDSRSVIASVRLLLDMLREVGEKSEERKWEVIRDAWMEMLTYAAVHCAQTEHARGVSRGGELLTHYWLLMAHYGIMDEYNAATRANVSIFMNVI
ncbi:hypothetical protein LUZ62_061614 [Rhynchospora pubera]|uniref:Uncharacterized protein n=1 Tax=Rhynchospora pubera TaxID=906938 RepID=A0AAV8EF08_9POAL|nr:hypothetical protein LUZ62_061614 [Rhynchospora pubera]